MRRTDTTSNRLHAPAAAILVAAAGVVFVDRGIAAPLRQSSESASDTARQVGDDPPIEAVVDPEARRVLERAIDAIGGRRAIDSITTSTAVHAMRVGDRDVRAQLIRARDGRFIVRQSISGMGEMEIGWTGVHGWVRDPREGRCTLVPRRAVTDLVETIDLQWLVRELDVRFRTHRSEGEISRGDRSFDRVRMTDAAKHEVVIDFDQATGLPATIEFPARRERSVERRVVELVDWTEARPLRWFRRARIVEGDRVSEAEWLAVTFDDVGDAALAPPADVTRLIRDAENTRATGEGSEIE